MSDERMPYHLRLDAPPLADCSKCHRKTWDADSIDRQCFMPKPDGRVCDGTFRRAVERAP